MDHLSENTIFLIVCMFFSVFGPERNRNVWSVLTFACLLNIVLGAAVFDKMDSAWLPAWYGFLELLTINLLYRFAWNPLGKTQALILFGAWICHICLYRDVTLGTNLVYDNYETLILAVMLTQLLTGTNGLFEMARDFCSRCRAGLSYSDSSGTVSEMGYTRNRIKVEENQGAEIR